MSLLLMTEQRAGVAVKCRVGLATDIDRDLTERPLVNVKELPGWSSVSGSPL
jgi:hypothetical protein